MVDPLNPVSVSPRASNLAIWCVVEGSARSAAAMSVSCACSFARRWASVGRLLDDMLWCAAMGDEPMAHGPIPTRACYVRRYAWYKVLYICCRRHVRGQAR